MIVEDSRQYLLGLWRSKLIVILCAVAGGVASALAAFLMQPKYVAESTLVIVEGEGAGSLLSGIAGEFGGLAALAGVNLPQGDRREEYLGVLKSKALLRNLIEREQLLPVLFAQNWDTASGTWKRGADHAPTINDGIEKLEGSIVRISEDRRSRLITLRVTWFDRVLAEKWANALVLLANETLRQQAVEQADRSIEYLSGEARKAQEIELRQSLYTVMESQIKMAALARSRPDYAFRAIDPAVMPDADNPSSPQRLMMVALGIAFGGLLGLALAVMRSGAASREHPSAA